MKDGRWFSETVTPGIRLSLKATKVLRDERTGNHELAVIDNAVFGRVLLLDGAVQVTSRDEFVYHEMMAHVPILGHGAARDVLIVGGGDCGLAEEVLKHESILSLTQVEIDPRVVDLAREHFADINAAVFHDSRFHLVIGDGAAFVKRAERRFDVILVDSTDPIGPGQVLFTEEFYRDVHECLNRGGILVTQNGVPFLQGAEFAAAMEYLGSAFRHVACYAIAVPTYFGGHLALGWSSDDRAALDTPLETLAARCEAAGLRTRYYTPAVHRAAFALPRYMQESLQAATGAKRD